MTINNRPIVTLNKTEREAVKTLAKVVTEFADKKLCGDMDCFACPFAMFCLSTDQVKNFEETLNDLANLE